MKKVKYVVDLGVLKPPPTIISCCRHVRNIVLSELGGRLNGRKYFTTLCFPIP